MSSSGDSSSQPSGLTRRLRQAVPVIIVSSVTFTFISYWRTAAVVLCDLASTVYYIGGIVENAIGPSAPWFHPGGHAVQLCPPGGPRPPSSSPVGSYRHRRGGGGRSLSNSESCSLFVRGGVYRVVKEAMGGFLAK